MKIKIKYPLMYLIWLIEFYILFAIQNDSFKIKDWDLMSKMMFDFYGIILGSVVAAFWCISDNIIDNK